MWVGVDDTDGPSGGCTTYVLTEILRVARRFGVAPIGAPRLVRLNPNVPWKTRGNAALSVRLGRGTGRRRCCGRIEGRPLWSYTTGRAVPRQVRSPLVEALWEAVRAAASSDPGSDPAMVVLDRRLPAALYREAVRSVVPLSCVERLLRRRRAVVRVRGSRRGIVGAASAISWPADHCTYELIAYRPPGVAGRVRTIDAASVRSAARRYPALFLCDDPSTGRLLVAPHTACPIVYGLRSSDLRSLRPAARTVRSEPVDRWTIFRTNQGTGDHVEGPARTSFRPYDAGRFRGRLVEPPSRLPGGHVELRLEGPRRARLHALVFEPTKSLPRVARSLLVGDELEVWGGRGRDPTFRVEGIELLRLVPRSRPGPRPRCPSCRRSASSMGRGRGYRCPGCRRRWPPEARHTRSVRPEFPAATYHPTASARRHLAPRPGAH